jgi:hypothetical protein
VRAVRCPLQEAHPGHPGRDLSGSSGIRRIKMEIEHGYLMVSGHCMIFLTCTDGMYPRSFTRRPGLRRDASGKRGRGEGEESTQLR